MQEINITISHKDKTDTLGEFTLTLNGAKSGELFYKKYPENYINIKHTQVDPSQRGKGLAQHLVSAAVMLAREENWKVKSDCPYAKAVLEGNPDYNDVYIK